MYKFSREQVLDPAFLTKLIRKFKNRELKNTAGRRSIMRLKTRSGTAGCLT